jgi:caffeoyl-CoA O-methyltransferase
MSRKTINLNDTLYDYLLSVSLREPPALRELRAETARHPMSNMQIAPEQGQFMYLLVKLMRAKKTIEIGVFTGYSALWTALALPEDGQLIGCDINEEYAAIARRYWEKAGVAGRIDLRLAPALDTLDALLADGAAGSLDFAFIDAVKEEYPDYYEKVLKLLRPGGLIAIDNVLWEGRPADPEETDSSTRAIREFNSKLHKDKRVDISLLPVADGLTLALKL